MSFNIFGPTFALLEKVLDLRTQRHTALSSNIANADTPNYKAVQVDFEKELQKALPRNKKLKVMTTHPGHVPQTTNYSSIRPTVTEETTSMLRPDGNTVDLDRQIVNMSKNQLMYNTVAQVLQKKFDGLLKAIKEVR